MLVVVWVAAGLADPNIFEKIMTTGIFNLGTLFFVVWVTTASIFVLQFAKLADEILLLVCFGGSFGAAIGLQMQLLSMENNIKLDTCEAWLDREKEVV